MFLELSNTVPNSLVAQSLAQSIRENSDVCYAAVRYG